MTLVERLRAADWTARLMAIAELRARQRAEGPEIEALVDCLGDQHKVVQRHAAEACAVLRRAGVELDAIVMANLLGPGRQQRWGAAYALALMGTPPLAALPVLFESLGADDGDVRWAAAAIVVHMQERDMIVEQLRALLRTGNHQQRKMAAYCLRDVRASSAAVERDLIEVLDHGEPHTRLAALSSLATVAVNRAAVARHVATLLDDADVRVRRAAAARLGSLGHSGDEVTNGLRRAAASADPALRRAAEGALRRLRV